MCNETNFKQWLLAMVAETLRSVRFTGVVLASLTLAWAPMAVEAGEWEQLVAAAEKEGKVVVSGFPGAQARVVLTEGFEAKFPKIQVEYSGLPGRQFAPRIMSERRVGKKLWDVYVGGGGTPLRTYGPAGVLDNLRSALMLPEVTADQNWHGGLEFGFFDRSKKRLYAACAIVNATVHVNRAFVSAGQFRSPKDLINPKFKGNIVMHDPRGGGPGAVDFTSLMVGYGEDFLKTLVTTQGVVYTRNFRQVSDWLVRGRYPIAIGAAESTLKDLTDRGLAKEVKSISAPGVDTLTSGACSVALLEGAPHPSAARVYINWLLSKHAQKLLSKATNYNSRRTDVPVVDPEKFPDPKRLMEYNRNDEAWQAYRIKATKLARQLIK